MLGRIRELCRKRGTNLSRLERELGFANGSLAKSDEKIQAVRLKAIADYFCVSMDYLYSGNDSAPVYSNDHNLNRCIMQLLELPPHAQEFIITTVQAQYDSFKARSAACSAS